MNTDAPSCLIQMPPPCGVRSCHRLGGKLKSAPRMNENPPSSREKTHVLHQIGIGVTAETDRVLEIRCEQQNLPAHDAYDPPCQS